MRESTDPSRMIESYLCARDRFLKPGGKMFPNAGTLCPLADVTFLHRWGGCHRKMDSVLERSMVMMWRCGVWCANLDNELL